MWNDKGIIAGQIEVSIAPEHLHQIDWAEPDSDSLAPISWQE
jgi:hypothetical protein